MVYAQISAGLRMHLAFGPGEEHPERGIVRAGCVSAPLCNQQWAGRYRMTINVPLGHACQKCRRRWRSLRAKR